MHDRIAPALVAIIVGSVVAILLIVPLVAISYRRHGGMTTLRTLGWAALLFWVLGLWAYTLLPLPSLDGLRCTTPQLRPFAWIDDALRIHAKGVALVANGALEVRAFNVLLFVPLGVLLRGVFGRGWRSALVGGFGASLLVEVTQLTGIWGLYPCAYRHFDVDDLIANTAGAMLGWAAVWAITRGRAIDTRPTAVSHLTARRRLIGMAADWLVVTMVALAVPGLGLLVLVEGFGLPLASVDGVASPAVGAAAALVVQGTVVLLTGATIGEHAVLLHGRPIGRHVLVSRAIRLLAGIGGYTVLLAMPTPIDLLAPVLALASVAAVLASPTRRGLATTLAGMELVDRRA